MRVFHMSNEALNDLWSFATGLYEVESVKISCLDLQDKYAANISLILWLAWLDASRRQLNRKALEEAQQIVWGQDQNNQRLLNQLRQTRTLLSDYCSFTRVQCQMINKHLLAAELAVEKVIMQRLQDFAARSERADNGVEVLSLFDYFALINVPNPAQRAARLIEKSRSYTAIVADSIAVH